jgi:hypothetical protein
VLLAAGFIVKRELTASTRAVLVGASCHADRGRTAAVNPVGTRTARTAAISLLLFMQSSGCRGGAGGEPASAVALVEPTAVLWVPVDASIEPDMMTPREVRNGRSLYLDGSAGVVFMVATTCGELARLIMAHFDGTMWRRRANDWLNPSMPTSFDAGCDRRQAGIALPRTDGRRSGPRFYEQWHGQWENDRGDIVDYKFMGADGSPMRGYASYGPAENISKLRSRLGR